MVIISNKIIDFIDASIEPPYKISPVSDGAVHYVFKLQSTQKDYYLKIRGKHYAATPKMLSDPNDLEFEAKALVLFNSLFPASFPRLVAYDKPLAALIMTSVMPTTASLLSSLINQHITNQQISLIGTTLATIHKKLADLNTPLRKNNEAFYSQYLYYHLGSLGYPQLDDLTVQLAKLDRQIILGDLSPKNIGIVNKVVRFYDFDAVHYGNRLFEVGFLAGHLALHTANQNNDLLSPLFNSYYSKFGTSLTSYEEYLLGQTILGTLLYRLNNKWVKYKIPSLDEISKDTLLRKVVALLDNKVALTSVIKDIKL